MQPGADAVRSAAYWRARLGRKVSLRYELRDDPSHPFSEAIGMVQSVEDDDGSARVSVVDRRGRTTVFLAETVVAAKDF